MPERASQPAFAEAARAGDDEVAPGSDPVAGGEPEEQGPIQAAMAAVVDVLDACGVTQAGRTGAGLEALLAARRRLVLEQQTEPLGVVERTGLRVGLERLEPRRHAAQAEVVQEIESGMGQHHRLRHWK